ncbi:MAG: glycosyltransferase family 4 protein [Candidatus Acidiferrales bacterium]
MRVLASAYACEPGKGSEPAVGWNLVRQIARFHEVWVITRENNRESIEPALKLAPLPNVHWIYFDLPYWARFWKKGRRGLYLYYYMWQIGAYFLARRLHREVRFDAAHHLTFVTYWMPSFLSLLPIPYIWGPVGGGETTPSGFWSSYSLRGKFFEILRGLARMGGEWDPFVRRTAKRAARVYSTTEETRSRLQALGCQRVAVHSQIAMHQEEIQWLEQVPLRQGNPFRVVSIGSLLHWKGLNIGLRSFAQFHRWFPSSEYWIIGAGPEKKRLKKLAIDLGVVSNVKFWGSLPRTQVIQELGKCDVLLHPSLHDSGGWVCLEAMAAGRPVVCLDCGGPAMLLNEDTGIRVPPTSPEEAVAGLAQALEDLASDSLRCVRMGAAARQRVQEEFDWSRKADFLRALNSGSRPASERIC